MYMNQFPNEKLAIVMRWGPVRFLFDIELTQ